MKSKQLNDVIDYRQSIEYSIYFNYYKDQPGMRVKDAKAKALSHFAYNNSISTKIFEATKHWNNLNNER
tara:strand:+ start:2416 stop:2622 length:207 start_codon:yes stop_codon:yes gene_type:complete